MCDNIENIKIYFDMLKISKSHLAHDSPSSIIGRLPDVPRVVPVADEQVRQYVHDVGLKQLSEHQAQLFYAEQRPFPPLRHLRGDNNG